MGRGSSSSWTGAETPRHRFPGIFVECWRTPIHQTLHLSHSLGKSQELYRGSHPVWLAPHPVWLAPTCRGSPTPPTSLCGSSLEEPWLCVDGIHLHLFHGSPGWKRKHGRRRSRASSPRKGAGLPKQIWSFFPAAPVATTTTVLPCPSYDSFDYVHFVWYNLRLSAAKPFHTATFLFCSCGSAAICDDV